MCYFLLGRGPCTVAADATLVTVNLDGQKVRCKLQKKARQRTYVSFSSATTSCVPSCEKSSAVTFALLSSDWEKVTQGVQSRPIHAGLQRYLHVLESAKGGK